MKKKTIFGYVVVRTVKPSQPEYYSDAGWVKYPEEADRVCRNMGSKVASQYPGARLIELVEADALIDALNEAGFKGDQYECPDKESLSLLRRATEAEQEVTNLKKKIEKLSAVMKLIEDAAVGGRIWGA